LHLQFYLHYYLSTMPAINVPHNWFATWFNSPYYHILYSNRNQQEATQFITKLYTQLGLHAGATVCDLACGKGRHSLTLNQLGADVTGLDLSEHSITEASMQQNNTLHFYTHDMRLPYRINYYDAVCNLFTSFGYFETQRENSQCAKAMALGCKQGGKIVVDFFNAEYVQQHVINNKVYVHTTNDVQFTITKYIQGIHVIKEIIIKDGSKPPLTFYERVQLITAGQFEKIFKDAGCKLIAQYGSYTLDAFIANTSDRLILIFEKN
jgi:SAM-dependent methyltransferase